MRSPPLLSQTKKYLFFNMLQVWFIIPKFQQPSLIETESH